MRAMRYEHLGVVIVAVALTASLTPGICFSEDARLIEAKKEGKVVWYTGAALFTADRVARFFELAYPGIKVEVQRSGSERILQRLMQEAAAGIKNADVFNSSDIGHYVLLKKKGMLAKYTPAGAERRALLRRSAAEFAAIRVDFSVLGAVANPVAHCASPHGVCLPQRASPEGPSQAALAGGSVPAGDSAVRKALGCTPRGQPRF